MICYRGATERRGVWNDIEIGEIARCVVPEHLLPNIDPQLHVTVAAGARRCEVQNASRNGRSICRVTVPSECVCSPSGKKYQ